MRQRQAAKKVEDVEALAAKAKVKREQQCAEQLQYVLNDHNCQISVMVTVGEQKIVIGQILGLPVSLDVGSK